MKFFSYSFGCRVNEAEKESIDRQLMSLGYVFDSICPDLYIINTCAITLKAEREARQMIYQVKKKWPNTKIIVTGCAITYWQKNQLFQNLPIDLKAINLEKNQLVSLIQEKYLIQPLIHLRGGSGGSNKFIGSKRVMIKIQDGCTRYCTYCIVPYLRGKPKSLLISDLVNKINDLDKALRLSEVILTAINTADFGFDSHEKLTDLLLSLISKTMVPRISLGSVHPWSIDKSFLTLYQQILPTKRLVNFFHIPLQSGSDKILKLMKRGYTKSEFVTKLNQLQKINQLAFIATDIIVGFFDENNSDFQDTYDFLAQSPISKFHVFRYSKRNNTAGFYLAKNHQEPTPSIKLKRARALIELSNKKFNQFLQKNINRRSSGLFLQTIKDSYQTALLDNQLPILIKTNRPIAPGLIKNVSVIGCKNQQLFGKII